MFVVVKTNVATSSLCAACAVLGSRVVHSVDFPKRGKDEMILTHYYFIEKCRFVVCVVYVLTSRCICVFSRLTSHLLPRSYRAGGAIILLKQISYVFKM